MSQSSPEGIILCKGSTLESFSLSINKEKVLELKQQERMYSEEELEVAFFEGRENNLSFNEWFEQFKKK